MSRAQNQKSPKSLIIITIFLTLFVLSAASFLVLKDRKIDFGKIFSLFSREKNEKQGDQKPKTKTSASLIKSILPNKSNKSDDVNKNKEKNLTESVGQRLAATALATNLDISELKKNPEIMERTLAGIEDYFKMPEISDDEIKISNDNSTKKLESYVIKMGNALKYGAMPIEYFEELQEKGTENINPEELPKIEQLLEDYQKSIDEIKNINVPSTWKEIHKEQLSILTFTAELLEATIQAIQQEDSVKIELAIKKLNEVADLITELETKIIDLVQEQQLFVNPNQ